MPARISCLPKKAKIQLSSSAVKKARVVKTQRKGQGREEQEQARNKLLSKWVALASSDVKSEKVGRDQNKVRIMNTACQAYKEVLSGRGQTSRQELPVSWHAVWDQEESKRI